MNAIKVFEFEGENVRIVDNEGNTWFVAKDVCKILCIKNHRDAVKPLDDDERDDVELSDAMGRMQRTLIISEGGMNTIIMRSNAAVTPGTVQHRFRKWVTGTVLPSIRKTGEFRTDALASRATAAPAPVDEITRKISMITEARMTHGPAYAARLWHQLGLPDAAKPLPPKIPAEAIACLKHLLAAQIAGTSIGKAINAAFQGDKASAAKLKELKIEIKGDGFTVPNVNARLAEIFKGTPWRRPFEHLRKLPGTKPFLPHGGRFAGEYTFLPSTLLDA